MNIGSPQTHLRPSSGPPQAHLRPSSGLPHDRLRDASGLIQAHLGGLIYFWVLFLSWSCCSTFLGSHHEHLGFSVMNSSLYFLGLGFTSSCTFSRCSYMRDTVTWPPYWQHNLAVPLWKQRVQPCLGSWYNNVFILSFHRIICPYCAFHFLCT